MKSIVFLITLLVCHSIGVAQEYEHTPKQIASKKRFEQVKKKFLTGRYKEVLKHYDSIKVKEQSLRLQTYHMAYISSHELAKQANQDSTQFVAKAEAAYAQSVKWYGTQMTEEYWKELLLDPTSTLEILQGVDQSAEFPGGMAKLYKFIINQLRYPTEAKQLGIHGKVFVQFVVNKDGSIDGVNAIKGIGSGCDAEAERVLKIAPDFKPGMKNGEPEYVKIILPVMFRLSTKKTKKRRKARN